MKSSDTPLVAIRCITYNQAPYIRQCLDGFIMQRTDFPFVAIVHDDCSTDGTDDIVREYAQRYPDIIKPIFETENQYRKGTLTGIMTKACNETGAKYIAMCEGDDYWTDPLKLQKQVDFLEKNPDCSLCYHAFQYHFENPKDGTDEVKYVKSEYTIADVFKSVQFQTATIMVSKDVYGTDLYNSLISLGFSFGDILLYLAASEIGRLMGINDVMSVYRISDHGVSKTELSAIENRVRNLELWIKALPLLNCKSAKALYKIVIVPGISICFVSRVTKGLIPFKRWFKLFRNGIRANRATLFMVPLEILGIIYNAIKLKTLSAKLKCFEKV